MTEEPLRHIARPPLPWRDSGLTVCGKPVSQYAPGLVINITDAHATVRRLGKQRFAMTHCMTCASHADRWPTWDQDPAARLARETGYLGMTKSDPVIVHEIRAIGMLIEAHREEFDERVAAFASGDLVTIDTLRRARSARQRQGGS